MAEDIKESCCFPGTWTSAHVKKLERQNYRPECKIDKIAFIINKSSMATAHLENIFLNLDTSDYDIVFMGPRSELECREKAYAQKYNCNVVSVNEVIARKLCYKLAVTMFGDHKSKKHMSLPAASGGVSSKRCLIDEARSVRKLFNCGGLLPFFVGVANSNRPKGRGIKPPLRIK
ncbi:MAG: hypothetical protein LBL44_03470, partial [Treponema sp.]|nr:hypothetical protein [Treponema sp.]